MRTFLAILAVSLLMGACGSGPSKTSSPAPSAVSSAAPSAATSSTLPATPQYVVETGADKLVLRIADEGGFIAPGYLLTTVPQFAMYGDGRVIVPGPLVTVFPGPLLPDLRQLQVTPTEIQKILAAADAAGLLGPNATYIQPNVSDASTTVFTTNVAGTTHIIGAYALGLGGGFGNETDAPARAKLEEFRTMMMNLASFLGRTVSDAEAYAPTAMRVFVAAAQAPAPGDSTQRIVTWPLTADPSTAQATAVAEVRCLVVSGADLAAFQSVARNANQLTVWVAPSGRYVASARPLYPDESGCPATTAGSLFGGCSLKLVCGWLGPRETSPLLPPLVAE
ncbi:MAG: hypothetical protein ABSE58_03490 [Candidatus Limnocylindrales bacterium]|jgi:hypothetical protein